MILEQRVDDRWQVLGRSLVWVADQLSCFLGVRNSHIKELVVGDRFIVFEGFLDKKFDALYFKGVYLISRRDTLRNHDYLLFTVLL